MAAPELERYRAKRHFEHTPEPPGGPPEPALDLRFAVQQHAARRMHYDFRLEADGVLISWAVPKGPSYDPGVKRLAVKVEDHPLDYREFEGLIPKGNYGAGSVIVWDEGTYANLTSKSGKEVPVAEAVAAGHLSFSLQGTKLVGGWSLTRFDGDNWALVKRNDEHADRDRDITAEAPASVKTGRTVDEVGQTVSPGRPEAVWLPPGAPAPAPPAASPAPATPAPATPAPATFLAPMLAQSLGPGAGARAGGPLAGPRQDWLLEPKLDGLRCIAVRNQGEVALFSRNRLSFNSRFPQLVRALAALPASNFVLDGEIVALVAGRPDFAALQQGAAADVEYWVFDLPWLLGQDLRHLPIEERKGLLAKAVHGQPAVKVVQTVEGEPLVVLERICREGWEGFMAKRAGSGYREGRSGDWFKLKCGCRQELVIGGFTEPGGARTGFGALLLGYWQEGQLLYAGKVGTGFTQATLEDLLGKLTSIERPSSPFASRVAERSAHWVAPELVAEVAFSNWTAEGRLRHPSFLGLRSDKAGADVVREDCGPRPEAR